MNTNTAVLCIGSNVEDADARIAAALCKLAAAGCAELRNSGIYRLGQTDLDSSVYANCVVEVSVSHSMAWLLVTTKGIEKRMGRSPELKPLGIVPIDLDIVMFNGEVVRPSDFASDYFMTGYLRL